MPALLLPLISNVAEQAVQIMNETNMPMPDQLNKVRRPSLSTRKAALTAAQKLKICKSLPDVLVNAQCEKGWLDLPVDQGLCVGIGDSNSIEDQCQIIGHHSNTVPLCEGTDAYDDKQPTPVAGRRHQ